MMGGYGNFGWFGIISMLLGLVITIGLIVGLVLLALSLLRRPGPGAGPWTQPRAGEQLSPREILQIRYARGEITREQYQQMLADLS